MTKEFPPRVPRNTDGKLIITLIINYLLLISYYTNYFLFFISPPEPDEDSLCRAEIVKLAENMKSAQLILMEAEKSIEEEAASNDARAKSDDEIRKIKMEELRTKSQSLSVKKAYLLELKERAQQQIAELIEQKNQLEQELSDLTKEAPVNKKTKLDPFSSSSLQEGIQQKEANLSDVTIKLSVIEEEDKDLRDRIREVDHELTENGWAHFEGTVGNLTSLITRIHAERESSSFVQLKALKREQLGRIAEFSRLQKKIFHINSEHILNDICRMEEELFKVVGVVNEN